jgi:hypothetical protein
MSEHLPYTDEQIIDYLDGQLSIADQNEFETTLMKNPGLQQRLEQMKLTIRAVKQMGALDQVRTIHQEMMQQGVQGNEDDKLIPAISHTRKIIRYSLAVAAGIILLFFVYRSFYLRESTDDLYSQAFVDYHVSVNRGDARVSKIVQLFNANQLAEVEKQAEKVGATSQLDSLLTGISYLKTSQPSRAVSWLQPVSLAGPYHQDAEFYLSLAYLKNGDTKTAAYLMRKIKGTEGHVYREQVPEELIRKVAKN